MRIYFDTETTGLHPDDGCGDEIGYEWTGSAHGSLADTMATKAVQEWIESRPRQDDSPSE